MSNQPSRQLDNVWSAISEKEFAFHKWPLPPISLTMLEALTKWGFEEDRDQILQRYELLTGVDRIQSAPVVAITGMLNTGKSSTTACFLSEIGQKRIPRGTSPSDGTHRFVLWMPDSWRANKDLLDGIRSQLSSVFGASTEELSDDAKQAHISSYVGN